MSEQELRFRSHLYKHKLDMFHDFWTLIKNCKLFDVSATKMGPITVGYSGTVIVHLAACFK